MRHATTAAALAAPLVVLGYLVTSYAYCEVKRRQREGGDRRLPSATIVSIAALLTTTISYYAIDAVAPRATTSAIAVFAPQALLAWESVALWTGVAAVLGHTSPVWNGFRGGSGLPAAAIVAFVYLPVVLIAGAAGWFTGMLFSKKPRAPLYSALAAAVSVAWLSWITTWSDAWGVVLGPESTVVTVVAAGIIVARNQADSARQLV